MSAEDELSSVTLSSSISNPKLTVPSNWRLELLKLLHVDNLASLSAVGGKLTPALLSLITICGMLLGPCDHREIDKMGNN